MLGSWNKFVFKQGFFYFSDAVWGSLFLTFKNKQQSNKTHTITKKLKKKPQITNQKTQTNKPTKKTPATLNNVILSSLKKEFYINKCCESFIRVKIPSLVWFPALIAASIQVQCLPISTLSAPVLALWHLSIPFFLLLAILCLDLCSFRRSTAQQWFWNGKSWLKIPTEEASQGLYWLLVTGTPMSVSKGKIWGKLSVKTYLHK